MFGFQLGISPIYHFHYMPFSKRLKKTNEILIKDKFFSLNLGFLIVTSTIIYSDPSQIGTNRAPLFRSYTRKVSIRGKP